MGGGGLLLLGGLHYICFRAGNSLRLKTNQQDGQTKKSDKRHAPEKDRFLYISSCL